MIAPTFADIFFSNAGKNGIVLARLSEEQVAKLLQNAKTFPTISSRFRLKTQTVTDGQGFKASFEIDPFRKFCLLEGLDDIGLTLRHAAALDTFEASTMKRLAEGEVNSGVSSVSGASGVEARWLTPLTPLAPLTPLTAL